MFNEQIFNNHSIFQEKFKVIICELMPARSMKMLQIQNGFFQGAQDSLHCYPFYFCL